MDSPGLFEQAREAGCALFEGDFFTKPILNPDREVPASKLTYLQLLNEVHRPELSFEEMEDLIKRDVGLTYKLLRFMNSVWFGLSYEVNSVRHALVLLGPEEVRQWVSLLTVRDMGDDKPRELLLRSLSRAKLAETLAEVMRQRQMAPELFLLGMFSVIDALTDTPMSQVLENLPINDRVKNALVGVPGGTHRQLFEMILAYERADWETFDARAAALRIDPRRVPPAVQEALRWANEALNEV